MFYRGKREKGKILERGFHGFGSEIHKEIENRVDDYIQTLIDIGTGSGRNLRLLADILKETNIISIDPSLRVLGTVNSMLKGKYVDNQIALIAGVSESLPFKEGFCDIVFSVMSLHHIEKIETALNEMVRVLNFNGKLVVIDWTQKASKLMNNPPSHFLPLNIFEGLLSKLNLNYQVKEYSTWYIADIYKN